MSARETDQELARVLVEAGETDALIDWMGGEARGALRDAMGVLTDPAATSQEREWARLVRDRLTEMFVELHELEGGA